MFWSVSESLSLMSPELDTVFSKAEKGIIFFNVRNKRCPCKLKSNSRGKIYKIYIKVEEITQSIVQKDK